MHDLTPSQTIGPFFLQGLQWAMEEIAGSVGLVQVKGRVLDVNGAIASDALLEIWQRCPDSSGRVPQFQRIATAADGLFLFVMPVAAAEPSHANVAIFTRGLQRGVHTRVYLHPDRQCALDNVPAVVPLARRGTLIAQRSPTNPGAFDWDVRLRGAGETVFFDF